MNLTNHVNSVCVGTTAGNVFVSYCDGRLELSWQERTDVTLEFLRVDDIKGLCERLEISKASARALVDMLVD